MSVSVRDQVDGRFRVAWPIVRPEILDRLAAFLLGIFDRYLQKRLDGPHFIKELLSRKPVVFQ